MHYPTLRSLMMQNWEIELDYLSHIHSRMGSEHAEEDARISFTLFRQLEQAAVMKGLESLDVGEIQRTLKRHMSLCFATTL